MRHSIIDDAIDLHRRGFSIFPLQPRDKRPLSPALPRVCLLEVMGGVLQRKGAALAGVPGSGLPGTETEDEGVHGWQPFQYYRASEEDVRRWFMLFPSANVAVATGEISGVFVLDLDGPESLEIIEMNGGLPETLAAHTSLDSTGFQKTHYYFKYAPGIRNSGRPFPGADIRGNGGYVMAPPSIHPSGTQYAFVNPETKIARAPAWLLALLRKPEAKPAPPVVPTAAAGADHVRRWCLAALEGECRKIAEALQGSRHHQRLKSAKAIGGLIHSGGLSYEEALEALAANPSRDAANARAAAISGLRAGMTEPRAIPEPTPRAPRWEAPDPEPPPAWASGGGSGSNESGGATAHANGVGNNGGRGGSGRPGLKMVRGGAEPAPDPEAAADEDERPGDDPDPGWGETETDGRPVIEVHDRQLSEKLSDVSEAVEKLNQPEPCVYQLVQGLGVIRRDIHGNLKLQGAGVVDVQNLLTRAARFKSTKYVNGKRSVTQVNPPEELAKCWLHLGEWPGVPALDSIATAPFVAADGTICDRRGYHPQARRYLYLPADLEIPDSTPTAANIAWARELIYTNMVERFPFADEASAAHALAQALLFMVRDLIDGPTPLHLWDAPTQGTGKSYGAETFMTAFTRPVFASECRDEEAWKKLLTSALAAGRDHQFFDNITGSLNSPSLAMAITSPIYSDRWLGTNTLVEIPVKTIWIGTANNAQLAKDAAKRCLVIRLDAGVENPETLDRDFKPREWVQAHRGEVLAAFMVLVRRWMEDGCPKYEGPYKSRFQAWQNVIGGILQTANIPEFLGNMTKYAQALDPEGTAWGLFVQAWWEAHGSNNVTSTQLLELANEQAEIAARLGDKGEKSQLIKLGKLLAGARDKVFSGFKIGLGEPDRRRTTTYVLTKVGESGTLFEDAYTDFEEKASD